MNTPIRTDLGMDEDRNQYSILVIDDSGKVIAKVYGDTPEECVQNADDIVNAVNEVL